MTTILKFYNHGTYRIIHHENDVYAPYGVTFTWHESSSSGLRKRTKTVARYTDLESCLFYLYTIVSKGWEPV